MYMSFNNVAHSHNYCCSGNTTMHCVCVAVIVVELQVTTVNYIKILIIAQQCFYCEFVTGNNVNYTYQLFKEIIFQLI